MTLALRLTLLLSAVFVFAGVVAVVHGVRVSERHFQAETQILGAPVAMYIAQQRSPFRNGSFDAARFADVTRSAMILNPATDVYALDRIGRVIAHGGEGAVLSRGRVALAPIRRFLGGDNHPPLLGDDPRHASRQAVFSVAVAGPPEQPWGYVYVILDGGARTAASASGLWERVKDTAGGSLAVLLLAGFSVGALLFFRLTMPLRALAREMSTFAPGATSAEIAARDARRDEIASLRRSFGLLRARVSDQMEALRGADAARREWVAHLSHDLRAPLAALQSHLEKALQQDAASSASERREAIARGLLHSGKLQRLLDQLFESARLDAPRYELRRETFDFAELVLDIVAGQRGLADRAAVEVCGPPDCPGSAWIDADISLFQRLIENLLVNALKASPRGGRVDVGVHRSGGMVLLTVADSGEGPTPDMIGVFNEGREPAIGAAGLGLRIVLRILRLHGLHSHVDRVIGGGSSVTIEIPVVSALPADVQMMRG